MTESKHTIGFIGIGLMGKPMVLRLLQAGHAVNVWNRSLNKLIPVVEAGAVAFSSVKELVTESDIVVLCLADTEVVVYIVQNHILKSGSTGKLLIDLSSIHPETTRHLADRLKKKCDMNWVDAPVSGGISGAEQGTLAIMAGGKEEDIAVARKVLKPLYQSFTHMGEVGAGQVTKICNQMIVSCNVLVIAEMMALAKQAGVDAALIPEALAGGFADSRPLQIVGPEMATHSFEPIKWRVKTLLKDLNMAIDIADKNNSSVPMSGLAAQLMQMHGNQGYLSQDPSTLIKLYEKS